MTRVRWIPMAALAGAVAVAGCGGGEASELGTAETGPPARVVTVEAVTVEPRAFTEEIRVTGTVQADRDVTVAAEESGVIREVFVEKGRTVRPGQPIARIDARVLEAQLGQARAQAELARETYERRKKLWEEDQVGSEMAYLESRYAAEAAAAQAASLETRLERTVVRAPIAGTLDSRMVEVGTMVAPGAPVARIVDTDTVEIVAGVPERYAMDVAPGTRATVTFDVLGGDAFQGSIAYVGSALDTQNRTFPVEVRVPNAGGTMKPGMVANVALPRRSLERALVVPREAVLRVDDGYRVYVVVRGDAGSIAEARSVTLGPVGSGLVVVASGLEPGEQVVVVGQQQVAGGDRVQVVDRMERTDR